MKSIMIMSVIYLFIFLIAIAAVVNIFVGIKNLKKIIRNKRSKKRRIKNIHIQ